MNDAVRLAHWILENRKGAAFKDYTMARICEEMLECANNGTMLVVEDEKQNIVGVYFGRVNHDEKTFFMYDILVTGTWVLKEMLKDFGKKYPGYSIQGIKKHGIKRQFNNSQQILERL